MQVLKQHIRKLSKNQFNELKIMCNHSRALYNSCLYISNEYFKETNKYIGLCELYKQVKNNLHYKHLPQKIAAQTLRLLDKDYRSFFSLLKRKNKGQYQDKVNPPKYKKKNSEFILILDYQQINIRNGFIKITKNLKIPFSFKLNGKLKQGIIKPKGKYYEIHLAYEPNEQKQLNLDLDSDKCLSIDLGLDNLATCFSNIGQDFIISGKPIKSYNQFYNKIKAKIQSELKIKNNKYWSNKLNKLSINRQNWINNYLNQVVNIIIKYSIKNKIGKIICGYNKTWKENINFKKNINQNFTNIPYFLLKQKLENKCGIYGINFFLQEESYTSKCSSLDLEEIKKHDKYIGNRIKRGLFKGSKYIINADINGAINIMRKVIGDSLTFKCKSIERCTVHPVKLEIINKADL